MRFHQAAMRETSAADLMQELSGHKPCHRLIYLSILYPVKQYAFVAAMLGKAYGAIVA